MNLDADPAVMRFVSGGAATGTAEIADWVIPRMQAAQREHGTGMWVLHLRAGTVDDGADFHNGADFVGWVQLRTPRHSRAAELELSYRLRRRHWGRGLAAEASAALIAVLFAESEVDRIFASTHPANTASRRVMEKLGMRLAAGTGADGRYFDATGSDGSGEADVEYELLREQWLVTRGRAAARTPEFGSGMTA